MTKPEHTHESDNELWLKAHHGAPSAKLAPGQLLTPEQRGWAQDVIRNDEEYEDRERRGS